MTSRLSFGLLLAATVSLGCAHAPPCAPWRRAPESFRPGLMSAMGSSPLGPDALQTAQDKATASLAAQFQVEVQSDMSQTEEAGSLNGSNTESSSVSSQVRTRTAMKLDGVQLVDTCTEDGQFHALVGIDRSRFAESVESQLEQIERAQRERLEMSAKLEAEGTHLESALLLWRLVPDAERADSLSRQLLIASQRRTGRSWVSASVLKTRAASAAAKSKIDLVVEGARPERIHSILSQCLGKSGMTVGGGSGPAEATVYVQVNFEPPPRRMPGSHLLRAFMTATIRKAGAEASATSVRAEVKSDGASDEAASLEGVRKLATEKFPAVFDQLTHSAGWVLAKCSN